MASLMAVKSPLPSAATVSTKWESVDVEATLSEVVWPDDVGKVDVVERKSVDDDVSN